MTHRTPFAFVTLLFVLVGCSSSSDGPGPTPPSDSATDSKSDSPDVLDALGNTCAPAGGTCIALTATSKCPSGSHTSGDPSIHCEGEGGMCCLPDLSDGGPDADDAGDSGNDCVAHSGECIALTASSKCPTGKHSSSRACSGVGTTCCEPDSTSDAASD